MAITFPGQEPTLQYPPNKPYPEIQAFPITSTGLANYFRGSLLGLGVNGGTAGLLNGNATNPTGANILGLALHDSGAIFQNVTGQPVISSLFGTGGNLQTPLWNTDLNLGLIVMAHNGQLFEFSYNQALPSSGSVLAVAGTAIGFTLTSGIWYADSTVTNKPAVIVGLAGVPTNIIGTGAETMYGNSDVNARVIVQITTTQF